MNTNQNIINFLAFTLIGYIIVWFWPVYFHHRLFYPQGCEYNCQYPGYGDPTPYYSAPSTPPAVSQGYEDAPVTIEIDNPSSVSEDPVGNESTVCTMDAKLCADGSSVGRIPPTCDFAVCPDEEK